MRPSYALLTATLVLAAACGDDDVPTGGRPYDLEIVASPTTLTLAQDSTAAIAAVVHDRVSGLNETVVPTFSTGDPNVATVSATGSVFATGGGTTNITLTYRDALKNQTLTQTIP